MKTCKKRNGITTVKDFGSRIIGVHRLSTKYVGIVLESGHGYVMNIIKPYKFTQVY